MDGLQLPIFIYLLNLENYPSTSQILRVKSIHPKVVKDRKLCIMELKFSRKYDR